MHFVAAILLFLDTSVLTSGSLLDSENGAARLMVMMPMGSGLRGLWASVDFHFAPQVVSFDMVEALAHIVSLLQVHPSRGIVVLSDQGELLGAAQATSEREAALTPVSISLGVLLQAKWAVRAASAVGLNPVLTAIHGIIVAGSAELHSTSGTVEQGDRAAVHALPVTVLVAMFLAHFLAVA